MNWKRLFSFGKKSVGTGGLREIALQPGSIVEFAVGQGMGALDADLLSHHDAMRFYRKSSAVSTAVDMIAQEIESIRPVVKRADGLLQDDHPVLDLLRRPNDMNESYSDFIGALARNHLITHNAYVAAVGVNTRPPVEAYAIKPQNVNAYESSGDDYPYRFYVCSGSLRGDYNRTKRPRYGARFYDGGLKELWQLRTFSSRHDNREGDSPLLSVCMDIWQHIRGRIHNVKLLENGGRPSLIVAFKGEGGWDQETHDARKQALREEVAGADNAGKILPISATDMDVIELGKSNRDMDYAKLDAVAAQAIYNRYRIPLPLVTADRSTLDNMRTSVEHLYDFAVMPNLNHIFSGLSMMLLPRYGMDPAKESITYNPEEIPALQARRIEYMVKRRELNVETINEIREGLPSREPIDGGDTLYQPATLVPVGEDIFTDDNVTTVTEGER